MQVANKGRTQVLVAGFYLGALASIHIPDDRYQAWKDEQGSHAQFIEDEYLDVTPDAPVEPEPPPADPYAGVPAHIRQIAEGIDTLPPEAFTADDPPKPKVAALKRALGFPVSAAERDQAMAAREAAKA